MQRRVRAIATLYAIFALGLGQSHVVANDTYSCGTSVSWPYEPSSTYDIGNNYGAFQDYGGGAYYHDGIDILTPVTRPVYAVTAGTVTHITTGSDLYSGIMVGDPGIRIGI